MFNFKLIVILKIFYTLINLLCWNETSLKMKFEISLFVWNIIPSNKDHPSSILSLIISNAATMRMATTWTKRIIVCLSHRRHHRCHYWRMFAPTFALSLSTFETNCKMMVLFKAILLYLSVMKRNVLGIEFQFKQRSLLRLW